MEEEIIPFQVSKVTVICGSFKGESGEDLVREAMVVTRIVPTAKSTMR
jgi:hypothetical protein